MIFSWFSRDPRPYDTGYVSVGEGHSLYYQQFGNPKGSVVLSFHGGPGGSGRAKHASHYDLKKWRVVLFDQRGCGHSLYQDAFRNNTSTATIKDALCLLNNLKIKGKITVAGGSFGAGLALLFAEAYPARVRQLILNSVFLMRPEDAEWVTKGSRLFYPDMLDELARQVAGKELVKAYHRLIFSDKYLDIQKAQRYFGSYEHQLGELQPSFERVPALTDNTIRSGRIYLDYEKNHFFVGSNQILDNIGRIRTIPAIIVHNRLDFCCPVVQAYDLHQALPKSRLVIVPDKGHGSRALFQALEQEIRKLK